MPVPFLSPFLNNLLQPQLLKTCHYFQYSWGYIIFIILNFNYHETKFSKGTCDVLIFSMCFACTTTIDNLMDARTPIVESSPTLVAEVKATTHFLGWGNVGDITISVKADKDVLPALTGKKTNLAPITSNLEGGFRMISVGGSLSAGFRDGGLYREGQLTSFPNLIARQMSVAL